MDPAEDIDELNNNIDGQIKLVNVFYGYDYRGLTPESTIFEDKNPTQQFVIWKEILDYNSMDFYCEIKEFWKYIFMNYSYWKKTDFIDYGITVKMKFEVLLTMKEYWKDHFPQTELIEGNT